MQRRLEAPLASVFPSPGRSTVRCRRGSSPAILPAVEAGRPRDLPNVGALARIQAAADAIDRERRLVVFRERLERLRRQAADARDATAGTMPLFTAADLAALKPLVAVGQPRRSDRP